VRELFTLLLDSVLCTFMSFARSVATDQFHQEQEPFPL
jgi:hypothetical protein